jgi:hypothetical protein
MHWNKYQQLFQFDPSNVPLGDKAKLIDHIIENNFDDIIKAV